MKVLREVCQHDCYRLKDLKDAGYNIRNVIDVGAHVGSFAAAVQSHWSLVWYTGVEAHQKNWALLQANLHYLRQIPECAIHAACDYGEGTPEFLDSILLNGTATGGSAVVWPGNERLTYGHEFQPKPLACPVMSLEAIMDQAGVGQIDLLKLDCEGAEHRLVAHFTRWESVAVVVGEYHGREAWNALIQAHPVLSAWKHEELSARQDKSIGIFRLTNPKAR